MAGDRFARAHLEERLDRIEERLDALQGRPPGGGGVDSGWPVGAVGVWPCAIGLLPGNFKECDAAVYDVADYPLAGERLGATHGGDGVTTFGVPDYRGRAVIGVGTNSALGADDGDAEGDRDLPNLGTHTHGPGTYETDWAPAHQHLVTGATDSDGPPGTPTTGSSTAQPPDHALAPGGDVAAGSDYSATLGSHTGHTHSFVSGALDHDHAIYFLSGEEGHHYHSVDAGSSGAADQGFWYGAAYWVIRLA